MLDCIKNLLSREPFGRIHLKAHLDHPEDQWVYILFQKRESLAFSSTLWVTTFIGVSKVLLSLSP